MKYAINYTRLCITILFSLFIINTSLGQHYLQEKDYSTDRLRCEKGAFRDTDNKCKPIPVLMNRVLGWGGRIYWVDGVNGNDSNSGSAGDPWKTIGRATGEGVLEPGDAVFIRAGVYYESIRPREGGGPERPIIFAAYGNEDVKISGAIPILTAWYRVEGTDVWWTDWSDEAFDFPYIRYPGVVNPSGSKLFYEKSSTETIYDDARRREVVIVNNEMYRPFFEKPSGTEPYEHALSGIELAGLSEGAFYLNELEKRMYVRLKGNASPEHATMQTSTSNHLFNPSDNNFDCVDAAAEVRNYINLVGLTFEHVSNAPQQGAVCSGRVGTEFNNVTVRWTNGNGFLIVGENHLVTDVGAYDNGMGGIRGGVGPGRGCDYCVLQYSESFKNNRKGFDPFWESGGGKWQYTTNSIFRYLNFSGNYGPGLWLDIQNTYNIVENSRFHGNFGVNLFIESQSSYNLIYNNIATHAYSSIINADHPIPNHDYDKWVDVLRLNEAIPVDFYGFGFQIHAGSYNQVLYNTLLSNDGGAIRIRFDERDPTVHNLYYNNVFMNFLDHEFYTDDRQRGHEIAIQNFALEDTLAAITNQGGGNNIWSHFIEGQPLTFYASFLYRLFDDGNVIQLRTNNILLWRDSTNTDLSSRMVDVNAPHIVDPTDWKYGWCFDDDSQFANRAVTLPPEVDVLREQLPGEPAPIMQDDVGAAMRCPRNHATEHPADRVIEKQELELVFPTALEPNYPDPFNPSTIISYVVAEPGEVTIKVYNMLGQEVATLINSYQVAGKHSSIFDASQLPAGVYIYRMKSGEFTSSRRMTLLK